MVTSTTRTKTCSAPQLHTVHLQPENPDYAIFIINLDRSPERLRWQLDQSVRLGFAFDRIRGVDGHLIPPETLQGTSHKGPGRYKKALVPGEVGACLGHVAALQRFLDDGDRYALILEDDVELSPRFHAVLQSAIRLRDRGTLGVLGQWDVLKLLGSRSRHVALAPLTADVELVEFAFVVPTAAAAAVWSRAAALRFLERFRGVRRPIDCELQHPWEFGLRICSTHPNIAWQRAATVSTIEPARHAGTLPHRRFVYEARRVWPIVRHFVSTYGWSATAALLWHERVVVPAPTCVIDGSQRLSIAAWTHGAGTSNTTRPDRLTNDPPQT